MIKFKINGKPAQIKSSWEEVTMQEYCEIIKGTLDSAKIISIFTKIPYENVKEATINGLESVLETLSFLNSVPEIPVKPVKCGKFSIPDGKIEFESLALFEDMRSEMRKSPQDIAGFTAHYAQFVCLYLQRLRDGKYNYTAAKEMIPEIMEMPALEVLSLGNFFLIKLQRLSSGTKASSPPISQSQKKSKPGTKSSPKRSDRTARSRRRR
jgi:hypothetical protein